MLHASCDYEVIPDPASARLIYYRYIAQVMERVGPRPTLQSLFDFLQELGQKADERTSDRAMVLKCYLNTLTNDLTDIIHRYVASPVRPGELNPDVNPAAVITRLCQLLDSLKEVQNELAGLERDLSRTND